MEPKDVRNIRKSNNIPISPNLRDKKEAAELANNIAEWLYEHSLEYTQNNLYDDPTQEGLEEELPSVQLLTRRQVAANFNISTIQFNRLVRDYPTLAEAWEDYGEQVEDAIEEKVKFRATLGDSASVMLYYKHFCKAIKEEARLRDGAAKQILAKLEIAKKDKNLSKQKFKEILIEGVTSVLAVNIKSGKPVDGLLKYLNELNGLSTLPEIDEAAENLTMDKLTELARNSAKQNTEDLGNAILEAAKGDNSYADILPRNKTFKTINKQLRNGNQDG